MSCRLSVVILTHNNELSIVDCLESVSFAEELIVIDDNSDDRTIDICKQYTKLVLQRSLNANFSNQRNFALNHAHGIWVLFVDSDEVVSLELRNEILKAIESKEFAGYYLRRVDFMWGRKILHGEAGEIKLLRLAKSGNGKWHGKVHETWRVVGKTSELNSPLIHIPHESVFEFIKEVDQYSSLRAIELHEQGKKSSIIDIVVYPAVKFVVNYFFKKGYKDGIAGLLYAMIMSFHSFLVRGKLYLNKNTH